MDHAHHDGADVGIELESVLGIVNCLNFMANLASGILEYLDDVGVDNFDARKLLQQHEHQ